MSIAKLEHQVAVPAGGSEGSRRLRVHGALRENAASRQELFMQARDV